VLLALLDGLVGRAEGHQADSTGPKISSRAIRCAPAARQVKMVGAAPEARFGQFAGDAPSAAAPSALPGLGQRL
jgi:hypothetical protein